MLSSLVRRAVPRGGALASVAASAFGAARGGHAPWSSSAVASTRWSLFAGTETVAARAGARSSAPFAASSLWAAAGAARGAEVVRTASGAARVRAFGVGAAASARAGTLSAAGASRAATYVATSLSLVRPSSVAVGRAAPRSATMHARRAYYNNSGVDASGRFRYGAPPPASPRFDGEQMLWSVVGANTFIFVLWHAVDPRFMQANFTVSERSVYTGSVHTLVTAAFSHYDFMHYASNMLALYYFGRDVGAMMGGAFLLNLYLAGGVVASATHVLWCRHERQKRRRRFRGGSNDGGFLQSAGRWMEHRGINSDGFDSAWRRTPPALGASGAVNAVVFLNAALFPMRTIYLNFFIPMPNILFAGMFLARDLYGAQMGLGGSGTGHAAHLGGAAVGAAAFAAMRAGAFRRGGFRGGGRFGG